MTPGQIEALKDRLDNEVYLVGPDDDGTDNYGIDTTEEQIEAVALRDAVMSMIREHAEMKADLEDYTNFGHVRPRQPEADIHTCGQACDYCGKGK